MKVSSLKFVLTILSAAAGIGLLFALSFYFEQPNVYYTWKYGAVFYLSVGLLAISVGELVIGFVHTVGPYKSELRAVLLSTLFALVAAEIALRLVGVQQTYSEQRNGMYVPAYDRGTTDIYRTWSPNEIHLLQGPEFSYERTTNSLGFSDSDFAISPDSVLVVQTYGDSYTEGDGAPLDSSYPALLQLFCTLSGEIVDVQNFGVCGNDPGFYYTQLRDLGSRFKPNVVVMTYGTGDLMVDVNSRGGLERFKANGWSGRKKPWFEWIYACSHVVRTVCSGMFGIHYNLMLQTQNEYEQSIRELEPLWNGIFVGIANEAKRQNLKILLVKRPERGEIDNNNYRYDFSFFDALVDTTAEFYHFDLLPYFRDSVGMNTSNTSRYFWPLDGHHNSLGYQQMAKGIHQKLLEHFSTLQSNKTDSTAAANK